MRQNAFQSDRREATESVLNSTGAEGDSAEIERMAEALQNAPETACSARESAPIRLTAQPQRMRQRRKQRPSCANPRFLPGRFGNERPGRIGLYLKLSFTEIKNAQGVETAWQENEENI